MTDTQTAARPVAITVICILGFIGVALTLPLLFSATAAGIGSWYPPFLGLSTAVGLVCMIGLWKMKKWAVFLYTALVAVCQVVLLSMGLWSVFSFLVPVVIIAIAFANLSKMT